MQSKISRFILLPGATIAMALFLCLLNFPNDAVSGQEKEKPKGDKKTQNRSDMITLTGTIDKKIMERKREDGSVQKVPSFSLIEDSGNKVQLPAPRRGDDGRLLDKIDLGQFEGKRVNLAGRGVTAPSSERPGAPLRVVRIVEITSVNLAK